MHVLHQHHAAGELMQDHCTTCSQQLRMLLTAPHGFMFEDKAVNNRIKAVAQSHVSSRIVNTFDQLSRC